MSREWLASPPRTYAELAFCKCVTIGNEHIYLVFQLLAFSICWLCYCKWMVGDLRSGMQGKSGTKRKTIGALIHFPHASTSICALSRSGSTDLRPGVPLMHSR
eukprot:scaffold40436_cov35-Tisochrysis_lutea.AAC.2